MKTYHHVYLFAKLQSKAMALRFNDMPNGSRSEQCK
jgi:hypothetical protein